MAPNPDGSREDDSDHEPDQRGEERGEYADVNGLNLYYEIHGTGRPLILLHGGLGSGEMFGPILPVFAAAPGLRGRPPGSRTHRRHRSAHRRPAHGRRHCGADRSPELNKPDLVGYSRAGGVAFFTAVKYPEKVGKLVMASANIRRGAIPPEMLAQQAQVNAGALEFMKDTPMYQVYQRVAPRPEDFGRLLDKIGESMSKDFDYSEEMHGLQVPTLIVCADADMAPPSHYVEAFKPRRRAPRRWVDGRGPAEGRARTRGASRPDPLQPGSLPAVRRRRTRLPRRAIRQWDPMRV